ncbi:D-TA family PLP-dependent enzyme [soil metagenome]
MLTADLATPALIIDLDRLDRNIEAMQARATAAGVALRPHAKTHKCAEIVRKQIDAGAVGITVATVAEAEAFANAGVEDIRVARVTVAPEALERLMRVAATCRVSLVVDTAAGIAAAAEAARSAGLTLDVLIEVDSGQGRCGVPWQYPEEAVELAQRIASEDALHLTGVLTHGGHAYRGPEGKEMPQASLLRAMEQERDRTIAIAEALVDANLLDAETAVVSVGSTPTASVFEQPPEGRLRVTELRPGNYVFHDAEQVALGAASLDDCALTALATVVSERHATDGHTRIYVDSGKKTLTSDRGPTLSGFGQLLHSPKTRQPLPHAQIVGLSEEHGWIEAGGSATLHVGDQVHVVPNHACVAVATKAFLIVVKGEEVVGRWQVLAR